LSVIFGGSWGSNVNWLEPKTKPPSGNFGYPKSVKRFEAQHGIFIPWLNIWTNYVSNFLLYQSKLTISIEKISHSCGAMLFRN